MDPEIRTRAISWIAEHFGSLGDLPVEAAVTVWVTVYRALELGATVEREGLYQAAAKMSKHGKNIRAVVELNARIEKSTMTLDFLARYVPIMRDTRNPDDAQLLVDVLKWGIIDAADMSNWRRTWARRSARADPMFGRPVPVELL